MSNQVSVYVNFDGEEDILTFCDEFESFYVVSYHDEYGYVYVSIKDTSIEDEDNQLVGIFPVEVFRGAVFFDLEEEEFEEDLEEIYNLASSAMYDILSSALNSDRESLGYVDNRGIYHENPLTSSRDDLPA